MVDKPLFLSYDNRFLSRVLTPLNDFVEFRNPNPD